MSPFARAGISAEPLIPARYQAGIYQPGINPSTPNSEPEPASKARIARQSRPGPADAGLVAESAAAWAWQMLILTEPAPNGDVLLVVACVVFPQKGFFPNGRDRSSFRAARLGPAAAAPGSAQAAAGPARRVLDRLGVPESHWRLASPKSFSEACGRGRALAGSALVLPAQQAVQVLPA